MNAPEEVARTREELIRPTKRAIDLLTIFMEFMGRQRMPLGVLTIGFVAAEFFMFSKDSLLKLYALLVFLAVVSGFDYALLTYQYMSRERYLRFCAHFSLCMYICLVTAVLVLKLIEFQYGYVEESAIRYALDSLPHASALGAAAKVDGLVHGVSTAVQGLLGMAPWSTALAFGFNGVPSISVINIMYEVLQKICPNSENSRFVLQISPSVFQMLSPTKHLKLQAPKREPPNEEPDYPKMLQEILKDPNLSTLTGEEIADLREMAKQSKFTSSEKRTVKLVWKTLRGEITPVRPTNLSSEDERQIYFNQLYRLLYYIHYLLSLRPHRHEQTAPATNAGQQATTNNTESASGDLDGPRESLGQASVPLPPKTVMPEGKRTGKRTARARNSTPGPPRTLK